MYVTTNEQSDFEYNMSKIISFYHECGENFV